MSTFWESKSVMNSNLNQQTTPVSKNLFVIKNGFKPTSSINNNLLNHQLKNNNFFQNKKFSEILFQQQPSTALQQPITVSALHLTASSSNLTTNSSSTANNNVLSYSTSSPSTSNIFSSGNSFKYTTEKVNDINSSIINSIKSFSSNKTHSFPSGIKFLEHLQQKDSKSLIVTISNQNSHPILTTIQSPITTNKKFYGQYSGKNLPNLLTANCNNYSAAQNLYTNNQKTSNFRNIQIQNDELPKTHNEYLTLNMVLIFRNKHGISKKSLVYGICNSREYEIKNYF